MSGRVCESLPRTSTPHQPAYHPLLHDADDRYAFPPFNSNTATALLVTEFPQILVFSIVLYVFCILFLFKT